MKHRSSIWVFLLVVGVLLAWYGLGRGVNLAPASARPPVQVQNVTAARNQLLALNPRQDDLASLAQLDWGDVTVTAEAAMADAFVRDRILAETGALKGGPLAYLRGLLYLARAEPAKALAEFSRAPIAELPVNLLYAPYRLAGDLRPGVENPFAAPLVQAAQAGKLEPLLTARVLVVAAEMKNALEAYMRTDPAKWSSYDLRLFGLMLAHEGHRGAAAAVLEAAYRGGRLPERLRSPTLATLGAALQSNRTVPPALRELVQTDPQARALFVAGAEKLFAARLHFLKGEDAALLADYARTDAVETTDEVVLMLTLASARRADRDAFTRWSAELARRYPQPEIITWIPSLLPALK